MRTPDAPGAAPDGRCGCAAGETPLWAAALAIDAEADGVEPTVELVRMELAQVVIERKARIYELFPITEDVRSLVLRRASTPEIRRHAVEAGALEAGQPLGGPLAQEPLNPMVLGVQSAEHREFGTQDVNFMQALANVIAVLRAGGEQAYFAFASAPFARCVTVTQPARSSSRARPDTLVV